MVDVDQLSAWLVVATAFVLLPFLLVGPNRPRHAIAVRLERLGSWALPRLQARSRDRDDPDGLDPLTDPELRERQRREQIYADLRRLHDLVRSDAAMSATRQIANRIAYDRLREQVAALGEPPVRVGPGAATGPSASAGSYLNPFSRPSSGPVAGGLPAARPTREVLDVGWRT